MKKEKPMPCPFCGVNPKERAPIHQQPKGEIALLGRLLDIIPKSEKLDPTYKYLVHMPVDLIEDIRKLGATSPVR